MKDNLHECNGKELCITLTKKEIMSSDILSIESLETKQYPASSLWQTAVNQKMKIQIKTLTKYVKYIILSFKT